MKLLDVKTEAAPGGIIKAEHIDTLVSKSFDDSIITVGQNGMYSEIKEAYDSATAGQLVWVSPGEYTLNETIVLKSNVDMYFAPNTKVYGTTGGIKNGVFFTDNADSITSNIYGYGQFLKPAEWITPSSPAQSQHLLGLSGISYVYISGEGSNLGGYVGFLYTYTASISGIEDQGNLCREVEVNSYPLSNNNKAKSIGFNSNAFGKNTRSIGVSSFAIGELTLAYGASSHAEGKSNTSIGASSHAEGINTTSVGEASHSQGDGAISIGEGSHSEGKNTIAIGSYSHAEGQQTTTIGVASHSEGFGTTAFGSYSRAQNVATISQGYAQTTIGGYNVAQGSVGSSLTSDSAFIIGNGTMSARGDAFRVTWAGNATCDGAFTGGGADYAESFEWEDGNPDNEDRVGYFVELANEDQIKLFETEGDEPLGIVSGRPAVIGDEGANRWVNKYVTDDWGRIQYETIDILNEDGEISGTRQIAKVNPDFDPNAEYTPRLQRKEWDAVGLLGKLKVWDDGTCQVNGWCKPVPGGTATKTTKTANIKYKVLKRITDNIILVLFK